MATRTLGRQSEHDGVVRGARSIYLARGMKAWINPGSAKNKAWSGRYIDVVAVPTLQADAAWVTEVETADSVNDDEAKNQWKDYDVAFTRWHLAVPQESKAIASTLLAKHSILHCTIITWRRNPDGTHTFWGLPGLE